MADRPKCIGCSAQAPDTDSSYTLISATHGWRLTRRGTGEGERSIEWRCPTCWNAHKNGPQAAAPAAPRRRV